MPRVLVVEHIEHDGLGALGDWLRDAGLDLDRHRVYADGPPPRALPDGYAGLVAMGGAMGVGDADGLPWLKDEIALLRDAVTSNRAVLGVCLGAQLLATACGGRVERGRIGPEAGAARVYLRDEAAADPLLQDLPPIAEVVQWHWDEIVALPPGAVHLAAGPAYPHQAFRVGERAWGLQFHVEARPDMVRRWAADDDAVLRAAGLDPHAVLAEAVAVWPAVEATWSVLGVRFAAAAAGS